MSNTDPATEKENQQVTTTKGHQSQCTRQTYHQRDPRQKKQVKTFKDSVSYITNPIHLKDAGVSELCYVKTEKSCSKTITSSITALLQPATKPNIVQSQLGVKSATVTDTWQQDSDVTATCTEVCGNKITGKSCSKICLVQVYPKGQRDIIKRIYAIIDDQSNQSLAKTEFFDIFNIYKAQQNHIR